jgi:hypothetical protein
VADRRGRSRYVTRRSAAIKQCSTAPTVLESRKYKHPFHPYPQRLAPACRRGAQHGMARRRAAWTGRAGERRGWVARGARGRGTAVWGKPGGNRRWSRCHACVLPPDTLKRMPLTLPCLNGLGKRLLPCDRVLRTGRQQIDVVALGQERGVVSGVLFQATHDARMISLHDNGNAFQRSISMASQIGGQLPCAAAISASQVPPAASNRGATTSLRTIQAGSTAKSGSAIASAADKKFTVFWRCPLGKASG